MKESCSIPAGPTPRQVQRVPLPRGHRLYPGTAREGHLRLRTLGEQERQDGTMGRPGEGHGTVIEKNLQGFQNLEGLIQSMKQKHQ